jgi:thiamine-phosphate diphosphorylase
LAWTSEKVARVLRLYAITNRQWLGARSFTEMLDAAFSVPGITCLQFREKNASPAEKELLALQAQAVAKRAGVPFLIDDDVMLAKKIGADGVHLGQGDMPCSQAREILDEGALIGVTAKTLDQARAAQAAGANYLGVGAVFPTETKKDTWTISHSVLQEICASVSCPVVAIGGITKNNVSKLAGSGIAGVAVVSEIFAQQNIPQAVEALSCAVQEGLGL